MPTYGYIIYFLETGYWAGTHGASLGARQNLTRQKHPSPMFLNLAETRGYECQTFMFVPVKELNSSQ
jgi:hypothetical protein